MVNITKRYACPECSKMHDERSDALTCCNYTEVYYQCECDALFDDEQDAIDCCSGAVYD